MGTESYTYMGRSFNEFTINYDSTSSAPGEFATTSSQSQRLLISCASENSDDFICQLVSDLHSSSIQDQKQAAMEIRLLAKSKPENRIRIAKVSAIKPLISLVFSQELILKE